MLALNLVVNEAVFMSKKTSHKCNIREISIINEEGTVFSSVSKAEGCQPQRTNLYPDSLLDCGIVEIIHKCVPLELHIRITTERIFPTRKAQLFNLHT